MASDEAGAKLDPRALQRELAEALHRDVVLADDPRATRDSERITVALAKGQLTVRRAGRPLSRTFTIEAADVEQIRRIVLMVDDLARDATDVPATKSPPLEPKAPPEDFAAEYARLEGALRQSATETRIESRAVASALLFGGALMVPAALYADDWSKLGATSSVLLAGGAASAVESLVLFLSAGWSRPTSELHARVAANRTSLETAEREWKTIADRAHDERIRSGAMRIGIGVLEGGLAGVIAMNDSDRSDAPFTTTLFVAGALAIGVGLYELLSPSHDEKAFARYLTTTGRPSPKPLPPVALRPTGAGFELRF